MIENPSFSLTLSTFLTISYFYYVLYVALVFLLILVAFWSFWELPRHQKEVHRSRFPSFWALLGASWAHLAASWSHSSSFVKPLVAIFGLQGASWPILGSILSPSGHFSADFWHIGAHFRSFFGYIWNFKMHEIEYHILSEELPLQIFHPRFFNKNALHVLALNQP